MKKSESETPTLKVGWWIALTVAPGIFPTRCYVGEIQSIDERGIRLTLIQWLIGTATGNDLFVTWPYVQGALVATDQHSLEMFGKESGEWSEWVNNPDTAEATLRELRIEEARLNSRR